MTTTHFPGILLNMRWLTTIQKHTLYPVLLVLFLCILPYLSILTHTFVWDDEQFILGWNHQSTMSHIVALLQGELPEGHTGVYRPVRSLLFLLSYRMFETIPFPYHLFSISIHITAIVLVFAIIRKLTHKPLIPILTALVFGLHPLQTEAITFATASFDTAGIVMGLGAIWCFLQWHKTTNFWWYIVSYILAVMAIFTNEIAIVVPLLLLLITIYFLNDRPRTTVIGYVIAFIVPVIVYLGIRFFVLQIPIRSDIFPTPVSIILTMTKVFSWYITKLVMPFNLSIVPVLFPGVTSLTSDPTAIAQQQWSDNGTFFGILLIGLSIAASIGTWKKYRLLSLGIAWFLVSLLPVSNIFPSGTLFAERYLYLPSIGFAVLLAIFMEKGINYRPTRTLTLGTVMIGIFVALGATQYRNMDWRSPVTLWKKTVSQVPDHPLVWNNLGLAYAQNAEFENAQKAFEQTLLLDPTEAKAYYNLGLLFTIQKKYTQAIPHLRTAITLQPDRGIYHYKLTEIYTVTGNFDLALQTLDAAPRSPTAELQYYGLAMIILRANNLKLARETFLRVVTLNPNNVEALNNLGALHNATEQYEDAIRILLKAVELTPEDYTIRVNLGSAYEAMRQHDEAIEMYEKAREINPFSKEIEKKLQHVYKEATATSTTRK